MPSTAAPSPPQRRAATVVRRVREAMLRLIHPVEARISPDGRAVAVAAAGPENVGLVLVPAGPQGPEADAQPPVFLAPPEPSAPTDRHSPRRLPDSRTLLHIAGFEGPAGTEVRLAALDTASGAVRTVAAAPGAVEGLLVSGRAARAAVRCRGIRHGFARCAAAVRLCADLQTGDALTAPSVRASAVPPAVPEPSPDGVHGQDAALVAGSVDRTFRSSAGDHAALRDVSPTVPRDSVVARTRLYPHAQSQVSSHGADSVEYVLVVSGQVTLVVNDVPHLLETGDTARFSGLSSHYYTTKDSPRRHAHHRGQFFGHRSAVGAPSISTQLPLDMRRSAPMHRRLWQPGGDRPTGLPRTGGAVLVPGTPRLHRYCASPAQR
ncbi:cupin domain-containing protein [Streptomyces atratus]|uniref:cupin domain-containing protein n=1 Tax=Streptomyces atratus TaxID=1893 RepID=UPI00378803CB